jgi:ubiquitin-protein ligase
MSSISAVTSKRLIKDIADIYKSPLEDQGIYYSHDDKNMLHGYAMIRGPKDTPYEHGFYLFEFIFPPDYPLSPPKVIFSTGDGRTRLNPNLYVDGKVCLSILNTWEGEKWTSCQTIRSVLIAILMTLNDFPLKNEPCFVSHPDDSPKILEYNAMISYKSLEIALYGYLKNGINPKFEHFKHIIELYAKEHSEIIIKTLTEWATNGYKIKSAVFKNETVIPSPYRGASIVLNYKALLPLLTKILT